MSTSPEKLSHIWLEIFVNFQTLQS